MVVIHQKVNISIPDYCPKCDYKLNHVNALNSRAKSYLVYCPNFNCKFCREYKMCSNCGGLVCL